MPVLSGSRCKTMYVYITIGILLLVALAAVAIARSVRRGKKQAALRSAEQQAEEQAKRDKMEQWLKHAESAQTDAELMELPENPFYYNAYIKMGYEARIDAVIMTVAKANQRKHTAEYAVELGNDYAEAKHSADKATVIITMLDWGCVEASIGMSTEVVGEHLVELLGQELAAARAGRPEALLRFLNFNREFVGRDCLKKVTSKAQRAMLQLPSDWIHLVTELFEAPSLSLYRQVSTEPPPGEVRLMAAEALADRSLLLGKLVLAYCDVRNDVRGTPGLHGGGGTSRQAVWPYRDEIGDVLLAEVTKMVHDIHVQQRMFAASR